MYGHGRAKPLMHALKNHVFFVVEIEKEGRERGRLDAQILEAVSHKPL